MLMKSPSCWLTLSWGDGDQDQMWEQRLVLGGSPNHALLRVCLAHHPASSAEVLLGWLWSLLGSWGTDWRVMGTRTRGRHLIITWDLECFHIVWGWLLGVGVAALLLYHWLDQQVKDSRCDPSESNPGYQVHSAEHIWETGESLQDEHGPLLEKQPPA